MTVVQADGNNVQPVKVHEFRIAVAETDDAIVQPKEDRACTIFAEAMGRCGLARGTLAPRPRHECEVSELRQPPLLTIAPLALDHAQRGALVRSELAQHQAGRLPDDPPIEVTARVMGW